MLTCLLMSCFAGIGTWRFGSEYPQFATFEKTLQTEFELLFGEFQSVAARGKMSTASIIWDSQEMAAFIVLYLLVHFLLVLNFLLAIIVVRLARHLPSFISL